MHRVGCKTLQYLLVVDYPWSLTDINAELPEELGTLLGADTLSTSGGTIVSAQNGIGSVGASGNVLQQTQMLDAVPSQQNHQQLSQLLAGNPIPAAASGTSGQPSVFGATSAVTLSRGVTSAAVAAANIANLGSSRLSALPGGVTTLGTVTNNIVTLSRQGNITLVPAAGTQGVNTVIGGHRVPVPTQQQQQLVAINTGVGSAAATLLSVTSPKATMARLQPMSSANIGAVVSLSAAGMVINVSQGQPPLPVSANGTHFGTTLVMPPRGATAQRFTGVTVQQADFLDGNSGNVGGGGGMFNPAQLAMPTVAAQQMGARVRHSMLFY